MPNAPNVQIERRGIVGLEVREDEGAAPKIVGYAAVYRSPTDLGWFTEEIAPKAFERTLRESEDILALYDHDWGKLLGRTSNQTAFAKSDDRGLSVEIDPPDTATGNEVVSLIKRGDLRGMSFGFVTREEQWVYATEDGAKDHRILVDVDLFEFSVVAWPAYDDTEAAMRSRDRSRQTSGKYRRNYSREIEIERERLGLLLPHSAA